MRVPWAQNSQDCQLHHQVYVPRTHQRLILAVSEVLFEILHQFIHQLVEGQLLQCRLLSDHMITTSRSCAGKLLSHSDWFSIQHSTSSYTIIVPHYFIEWMHLHPHRKKICT